MIAMAIALDPEVLIADEPTTALDVTVQAQIMELLEELQEERQMGLILITHDLGVVADVADRIAVMYAGRIVEQGDIFDLYAEPGHPYTKGLLESIPRLDQKGQQLAAIGGLPPNLPGSRRAARSTRAAAMPRTCAEHDPPPPLREVGAPPAGGLPLRRAADGRRGRAVTHEIDPLAATDDFYGPAQVGPIVDDSGDAAGARRRTGSRRGDGGVGS